jgi:branched-chain amino acid transport system substrate-binding protein
MHPRYISTSRGAWEIGLVISQTGRFANIGTSQLEGAILAIDEINAAGGIDGLPLSPIVRDDASDPQRFLHLTDLMLREEGVNIVFGGSSPEARRSATSLFERRNGLLFYLGLGDGFDFSPNIFCFGLLPNQACGRLLHQACGADDGGAFIVYRDDLLSRGLRDCVARDIVRTGGSILGEAAIIDPGADIDAALARIEVRNAAKVLLVMGASDSVAILRALRAAAQRPKVVTFGATEKDLGGLDQAEGLLTVSTYCAAVSSPIADVFNTRFDRRYGKSATPNGFSEASYCAMCLFGLSLEQARLIETDAIRDALLGVSLRGPQGQVSIDPESNCAGLWPRVLRWSPDKRFEVVAESAQAVPPDPFLVARPDIGSR